MRARGRRKASRTGAGWWVRQTVSWFVLFSVLGVLLAAVVVPRLTGSSAYTVLTTSMRPSLSPGTLVITKPVAPEDLKVGDAVTYQIRSGAPDVVTHRITSVSPTLGAELLFTTQGDANPAADEKPVKAGQIRGAVWYSIPLVGFVNSWLSGEQRIWAVGIAAAALLGYSAFMCIGAVAEATQKRRRGVARPTAEAP
ncbi:signal peptidase I [Arthrobacter sp. ZGTC131]|uniref:signal peptidase I n=1 Tax=Arthrobacter sp. ZGTC131 TaxID=2058898 RepID=UPI000CE2BF66|nr:signal peptidase I [Arthrobacter sp. ZGTC131]